MIRYCVITILLTAVHALVSIVNVMWDMKPVRELDELYCGFNIDTGSIFNNIDLRDPVLLNLARQVTPAVMRIGGTAADSALYFDKSGPCGGNTTTLATLVTNDCWNEIVTFANETGFKIIWDLNGLQFRNASGWDPSQNATALFEYAASVSPMMYGWQIGNEPEYWPIKVNGSQLAHDFITLRNAITPFAPGPDQPGIGQTIIGASFSQASTEDITEFMQEAGPHIQGVSMHFYPLAHNTECNIPSLLDRTKFDRLIPLLQQYTSVKETVGGNFSLVYEETAASYGGGCQNLTDRFISGFYYLHILGLPAEYGFDRVSRQDLLGWSFQKGVSNYQLVGPPGWVNASIDGQLAPRPDYFTAVLWRQIMSQYAFTPNVNSSTSGLATNFTAHIWCASSRVQPTNAPAVALGYVNWSPQPIQVNMANIKANGRAEYFLTSSAAEYKQFRDALEHGKTPPSVSGVPGTLTDDAIFLNGQQLMTGSDGLLPEYPLPGHQKNDNNLSTVPPYSYGFIVYPLPEGAGICDF